MKTKNFFVAKLVAITLMLGFFSPSINIQEVERTEKLASATKLDLSQGLLAKLSTSEITFTLFTQAEARKKKRYNKKRRKARRRAVRRGNYRHHRRHRSHRGGYYDRGRNNTGAVIGAAVVGAVVGAAINESGQD